MSLIAVVGDGATTTALGIAVAWSPLERCLAAEFDPAGGSLAAWLDVPAEPGLSTIAAHGSGASWPAIEAAVQRARGGVDVLVAPHRAVEAAAVLGALNPTVLPVLSAIDNVVVIGDGGRHRGALSALTANAGLVVVSHRQHAGSAAAAALGLERVAELCELLRARAIPTMVALIGDTPYGPDEVANFVGTDGSPADVAVVAHDPWAASVLAGRAGSAARLRRSPLMKSLRRLAGQASARLRHARHELEWDVTLNDDSAGSSQ